MTLAQLEAHRRSLCESRDASRRAQIRAHGGWVHAAVDEEICAVRLHLNAHYMFRAGAMQMRCNCLKGHRVSPLVES